MNKSYMIAFAETPLSLYIHIPWCIKKCPYCDFNSHAASPNEINEQLYVAELLKDLTADLPKVWGRRLSSIFIGGGTPSLLSGEAYQTLISAIRALIPFAGDIEITMEANPSTFETERFKAYRKAGINRLSIGIQSFSDQKLKALGRIHNADDAKRAIGIAKQAGFDNINLDLMFALPNQSLDEAMADLEQAISFQTNHLSWYQLTLEPNTLFYHNPPKVADDDLIVTMMAQGKKLLAKQGFDQYEISAYSKPKKQCKHNLNYWQFGDYLGIGAGAHAKISDVNTQTVIRYTRHRSPKQYMAADNKVSETRVLNEQDLVLEFMMNQLRIKQGFDSDDFYQATGLNLASYQNTLKDCYKKKLLVEKSGVISTTELGQQYLNEILLAFS